MNKLEIFHMRFLRIILDIKWCDVMEINQFNDIRNVKIQVLRRKLMSHLKILIRLLLVFWRGKIFLGRSNRFTVYSMIKDVEKFISRVGSNKSFKKWLHTAYDELTSSMLLNTLDSN